MGRIRLEYLIQLKGKDIPLLRDKILKDQNGVCPLCNKKVVSACLDHEHKKKLKGTGLIRGVLCRLCNIYLGRLENGTVRYGIQKDDVPFILRNAADYLEKDQYPFLHPCEAPITPKLMKSSYKKLVKKLSQMGYTKKIPVFRDKNKKNKNVQILTKPLAILYKYTDLKPEFYP